MVVWWWGYFIRTITFINYYRGDWVGGWCYRLHCLLYILNVGKKETQEIIYKKRYFLYSFVPIIILQLFHCSSLLIIVIGTQMGKEIFKFRKSLFCEKICIRDRGAEGSEEPDLINLSRDQQQDRNCSYKQTDDTF